MLNSMTFRTTLAAVACAVSVSVQAMTDVPQKVEISAGDLRPALVQLSRTFGVKLLYQPTELNHLHTAGVTGNYTADAAVRILLKGTSLELRTDPSGAMMVIDPKASRGSMESALSEQGSPAPGGADNPQPPSGVQLAQAGQGIQSGTPRRQEEGFLEEITVTAQRRPEDVDKVPISITALSQRTMDDLHIESISDLASVVPGLVLSPSSSYPDVSEIAIRGIYNAAAGNTAPTTQLYIDETPIAIRELADANSRSPTPNIFDLDHVEVLRGPQGTLFGASAMGGAIRFITPQPSLTDASGTAKAEIGFTDGGSPSYEVGAAYGGPIVAGEAGFRVSAWYQSVGGFIDRVDPYTGQTLQNNANNGYSYVVRPAVTWHPSDDLTITGALFLDRSYAQNPDQYWVTDLPSDVRGRAWAGTDQPFSDNLRVSSLSIKYDFAGASFVSDTSYLDRRSLALEDVTNLYSFFFLPNAVDPALGSNSFYYFNISYTHAWQEELRLSSKDSSTSPLSWVLGAFFRDAVQNLQQTGNDLTPLTELCCGITANQLVPGVSNYTFDGKSLSDYVNWSSTDRSEALFADVTYKLLPDLKLDVGARVERVEVLDQTQFATAPENGVQLSTVNLPNTTATPVTPRASLTYQVTPEDMVYVSAAKGFRPGGGNAAYVNTNSLCDPSLRALGLTGIPLGFSPDSLWSYEVGTKDTFFERHLSIAASIFHIRWTDIQTSVAVPSCQESFITNQGEEISNGFDLQLNAKLTEGLSMGGVISYTDTYLPNAAYTAPLSNGQRAQLNGAGDRVLNVIPWTAAVNAQYSFSINQLWGGARSYLRLDYRWQDTEPAQDPRDVNYDPEAPAGGSVYQPAFGVLNVRLGITHERLDLSAYVNNVTNADPRLGYTRLGLIGDPIFYAGAIRPLTAGITVWYRF
jgi:iron complex outermembrane receptor protein